jgi:hypothetical protein
MDPNREVPTLLYIGGGGRVTMRGGRLNRFDSLFVTWKVQQIDPMLSPR